jgi:hypothetical protein
MLAVLQLLVGGGLLFAGRKLFWLLVGGIGFAIGLLVATRLLHGSELFTIGAALAIGIVFALLALLVESVAIGLAAIVGGGFVGANVPYLLGFHGSVVSFIGFIAGAILGVILVRMLFNWGLIAISALAGASMIVNGINPRPGLVPLVFVGLLILGVVIQTFGIRGGQSAPPSRSSTAD